MYTYVNLPEIPFEVKHKDLIINKNQCIFTIVILMSPLPYPFLLTPEPLLPKPQEWNFVRELVPRNF